MSRFRGALSTLAAVVLVVAGAPGAGAASSGSVIDPVFNDASCVPSPAHPNPVVYLHGTGSDSTGFAGTAGFLRERGFCVWTLHHGSDGTTLSGLTHATASALDADPGSSQRMLGASTLEQRQDSEFIAWLSGVPDTTPGVVYTTLYTPSDAVATPSSTSMLEAVGGADVANVDVEATCGRTFSHYDLPGDPGAAHLIHWGLTRGPGDVVATGEDCGA
ncbi:esterase/lipase family protein [Corynebacterium marinum]|uniref:esterase/lipase family protein n=1 Tax=Corynebacterium marinum TaxID=349751 RepID=UPI0006979E07|nr:alpha/beta hydrolase [Corynebacterium marinum]